MTSTPLCSIILVNCNGGEWIIRCLDSIERHCTAEEACVIIVDNASMDGSCETLATRSSRLPLRMIHNPTNVGFGRACNQGVQGADTHYILLLNSDCEFRQPTIRPLAHLLQKQENVGIVFCKLLNSDLTVQPSVNPALPTPLSMVAELVGWSTFRRAIMKSPAAKQIWLRGTLKAHDVPHDVAWGGGNFMFMRRTDFLDIGGFDEAFFLYFEDADLCLRTRRLGRVLRYVPEPTVVHHWARSTAPNEINPLLEHYRSRLHYAAKHFGPRWSGVLRRAARWELWLRLMLLRAHALIGGSESSSLRLHRHREALKALL